MTPVNTSAKPDGALEVEIDHTQAVSEGDGYHTYTLTAVTQHPAGTRLYVNGSTNDTVTAFRYIGAKIEVDIAQAGFGQTNETWLLICLNGVDCVYLSADGTLSPTPIPYATGSQSGKITLLDLPELPTGTHLIAFGIDGMINGQVDTDNLYYDFTMITVTE